MYHILLKELFYSVLLFLIPGFIQHANSQKQILDSSMHYIRNGDKPEWEEFYNQSPIKGLSIQFQGEENFTEQTLQLRQYEVKQAWQIILNGKKLGTLVTDVNDMNICIAIPPKALISGQNILSISPASVAPDDIMVGQIVLHKRTQNEVLYEANLEIEVVDKKSKMPIPSRITITNKDGVLQMAGAKSNENLAVRPGNVYTLNGKVSIGIPAGQYTIYAGRGFEYSVDSIQLVIKPGEHLRRKFVIYQEVSTEGWISADTHIHTYTYSGHGDATIEERALSIAGEGIELPVITDHNIKIDIVPVMKSLGVNRYCTPVMGMEFTTNLGHFNIFPVETGTPVPEYKQLKDWNNLNNLVNPAENMVVILNHARDIHAGFRPFDPKRHLAIAGVSMDGWKFPANAMEVINSGSLQTSMFRLYQDWFGMMNRGHFLPPVGSSDSHDVSRYLVGQARTYIIGEDKKPDQINVNEATKNFQEGKVAVSLGLFTKIKVNNKYGAGELVPASDQVTVSVQVLGPGWTKADRISLYANGKKIREAMITNGNVPGLKWKGDWVLPKFKNDVFLVAVAEGLYKYLPFWPLVKPYQPTSDKWTPAVMGSTGAVWIDSDDDGLRTSAYDYANETWKKSHGDIDKFIQLLGSFDEAVTVQAASILQQHGWTFEEPQLQKALHNADPATKSGFQNYLDEWNQSMLKR
jgi:hypothetical protein